MTSVTPAWEGTGFSPKWSWPYVGAYLPSGCRIYRGDTGVRTAAAGAWFAGWASATSAMGLTDITGGQRRSLINAATGAVTPLTGEDPATVVGAVATPGHWASTTRGGVVRLDGNVIDTDPRNLGIMLAGEYLVHRRQDGVGSTWRQIRYLSGVVDVAVTPVISAVSTSLSALGYFAYGDAARVRAVDPSGTDTDLTATSPATERCPTIAADGSGQPWVWSPAGANATYLVVRQYGAMSGYVLVLPWSAASLDVVYASGAWRVAWASSVGRLGVATVTLSGTLVGLPMTWPPTGVTDTPASDLAASTLRMPPLRHPMLEEATGLVTKPWAAWFEQQARASATNPYADVPANSIIGRGADGAGPATTLTVGTGLTIRDGVLQAE